MLSKIYPLLLSILSSEAVRLILSLLWLYRLISNPLNLHFLSSIEFNFNLFLRKNPDGSIEIVGIEPALPKPTMSTILDKAKEIAEKNCKQLMDGDGPNLYKKWVVIFTIDRLKSLFLTEIAIYGRLKTKRSRLFLEGSC